MKYLLILITTLVLFWACSDDSASSNDDSNSFTTEDVNQVNTYYTFSTNETDTTEPASWDVRFSVNPLYIHIGGCQYMTQLLPLISIAEGATVSKVDAPEIDQVTTIPDAATFMDDIVEPVSVIGKKWFNQNLEFSNEVYAIKNCSGNLALFQPYAATYTGPPNHQLESIKWRVKFNGDGSDDFSNTSVDSFVADNAYTIKQYYSFLSNDAVTENDANEIVLNGSSIMLGKGTQAKNLGVTDINVVTTVDDDAWEEDDIISWYDYNLNGMHRLTPKSVVYVIHTPEDKYAAIEVVGYNDGVFTVFWKYLE